MAFDIKTFCEICEESSARRAFRKQERLDFPQNSLMLQSAKQINMSYKFSLDEMKREAGILPEEIYISPGPNDIFSVNLGATLLAREVIFHVALDVRTISRKCRSEGRVFSFENEVMKEHRRCEREFKRLAQEITLAWPAETLDKADLLRTVKYLKSQRENALTRFSGLAGNGFDVWAREKAALELTNTHVLLRRVLRILNSRTT